MIFMGAMYVYPPYELFKVKNRSTEKFTYSYIGRFSRARSQFGTRAERIISILFNKIEIQLIGNIFIDLIFKLSEGGGRLHLSSLIHYF